MRRLAMGQGNGSGDLNYRNPAEAPCRTSGYRNTSFDPAGKRCLVTFALSDRMLGSAERVR